MNNCCSDNCKKLIVYEIDELFLCGDINFYAVVKNVWDNLIDCKVLSFLNKEELEGIFAIIETKWCYFLENLSIFFRFEYVIKNIEKLRKQFYSLFVEILDRSIIQIVYYIKSLDYRNYADTLKRVTIYSVNDEPERRAIDDTDDFMKTNITNQNATDISGFDKNLNKIFDELANRNNPLNNLFDKLRNTILKIITPYNFFMANQICAFETKKRKIQCLSKK